MATPPPLCLPRYCNNRMATRIYATNSALALLTLVPSSASNDPLPDTVSTAGVSSRFCRG